MNLIPADDRSGAWVRLVRNGVTVSLARWPGPHRPGEAIVVSDGGRYEFERLDPDADGSPEAVYIWRR